MVLTRLPPLCFRRSVMPFGLPNLEHKISRFIEGDTGITAVREIEFDRKYLWLIDFEDANLPEPFDSLFPASSFDGVFSSIESDTFRFGQNELALPTRAGQHTTINVTFYDDINRTLYKWITDWINVDLLNRGNFVSGLKDSHQVVGEDGQPSTDSFGKKRAVKPLRLMKVSLLDGYRKSTDTKGYYVYPTGEIQFGGSHDSAPQEYTVTFVVAGTLGVQGKSYNAVIDILRDIAGRII